MISAAVGEGETLTFQNSLNSTEPSAIVAFETERSEPQEDQCSDWCGETLTIKNTLSCILNSAIISTKMPTNITKEENNMEVMPNKYSNEKYYKEKCEPAHRPHKYYADRNEAEHHRQYHYNNQHDNDRETRRKTTAASNKRYYADRDEPEHYKSEICWWHMQGTMQI